jgi:hypothetical protein
MEMKIAGKELRRKIKGAPFFNDTLYKVILEAGDFFLHVKNGRTGRAALFTGEDLGKIQFILDKKGLDDLDKTAIIYQIPHLDIECDY